MAAPPVNAQNCCLPAGKRHEPLGITSLARSEARIKTSIWSDDDFLTLDFGAQRLYLLILSQPTVTLCGVVPLMARRWARLASNTTVANINKALVALAQRQYVVVDETTDELWIRTFVKHDRVLDKPNVMVAMSRDFATIQSQRIRERFLEGLEEPFRERLAERFGEQFWERLAEPFRHAFEVRFPERFPHRVQPRAAAHAEPPSPSTSLRPPSTQPPPPATATPPPPPPPTVVASNGQGGACVAAVSVLDVETQPDGLTLTRRLLAVCQDKTPGLQVEAAAVIGWAKRYVADTVVDEAIGYCAGASTKPRKPRAIATVIRQKASDRGVDMPEFNPAIVGKLA